MSRTYRRTRGDMSRRRRMLRQWQSSENWSRRDLPLPWEPTEQIIRDLVRWHQDGKSFNLRNTPSWYTHQFMTRPQRVEVRRLIHQVMRLADLDDAPIFPHPKRPHWYYW